MHKLALPFALLTGLTATSCLDLPEVEGGTCGNKIIDANEDCDGAGSAPEGTVCRSAGSVGACRFDCGPGSKCPTGYACGSDSICRAHSGAFTDVGTSVSRMPTHLVVDDFDGDGRSDLLAYDLYSGEVRALFLEPSGATAKSVLLQSDGMVPAAGKLAGVAAGAFTFATAAGLGVMRGQTDRSFAPTPYSSLKLPWSKGQLVTLEAMPPKELADPTDPADPTGARWLGDEAVIFHGRYAYATEEPGVQPTDPTKSTFRLPSDETPVAPVRVANLDSDPLISPCDELVLSYGDDKVHVVTPCMKDGNAVVWNRAGNAAGGEPIKTYPVISLVDAKGNPVTGLKIRAVFVAQLNAPSAADPSPATSDRHLDMVINTWAPDTRESRIFVAMGDGTGHFFGLGSAVPNRAVEAVGKDPFEHLLAVSDIDLDGSPDFVFPTKIIRGGMGNQATIGVPHNRAWTDAVIADFNGDGLPDVMCSASSSVGIDFFTNAGGGVLNPLVIPTEAPVSAFVVGDFDGDLTQDVAFRLGMRANDEAYMSVGTAAESTTTTPDSLGVIYGRFGQLPEPPRIIGELATIESIFAGRSLVTEYPSDGIADLGVLSSPVGGGDTRTIAVFQGRGDRQLQSPFNLTANNTNPFSTRTILATATGSFSEGDGAEHVDVSALVVEMSFGSDAGTPGSDMGPRFRLWILPSQSTASLDIATAKTLDLSSAADASVDWWSAELTALDVDGDGQDEVLITAPYSDFDGNVVNVSVARLDESGSIVLAGPFPLAGEGYFGGFAVGGKEGGPAYLGVRPATCVADLDGDGKKDLAILAYDETPAPRVVVLWGTGDTSAPFETSRARVPIETDYAATYTCADVVPDEHCADECRKSHELVILSDDGAYSVDFDERTPKGKVRLAGVDSGNAVASGDFDGDGIADLFVSTSSGLRVYRGAPVIP